MGPCRCQDPRGDFNAKAALTQEGVLPILFTRCVVCHGGREKKGGLDLRTRRAMLKGGKSGPGPSFRENPMPACWSRRSTTATCLHRNFSSILGSGPSRPVNSRQSVAGLLPEPPR
ncbi:MAG: hypothetical protein Ct9H300mP1_04990 [Planctomycetaceae bacterium]|nr:MAG: hypothetical protein Ct9H300mP1_04990 [Planctomycetaceae bacterium]